MSLADPVEILEQRAFFLEAVTDLAKFCNWTDTRTEELKEYVHEELIRIDNLLFNIYEDTQDREIAYMLWEEELEDLRRWLSMVLGIRIRYT